MERSNGIPMEIFRLSLRQCIMSRHENGTKRQVALFPKGILSSRKTTCIKVVISPFLIYHDRIANALVKIALQSSIGTLVKFLFQFLLPKGNFYTKYLKPVMCTLNLVFYFYHRTWNVYLA